MSICMLFTGRNTLVILLVLLSGVLIKEYDFSRSIVELLLQIVNVVRVTFDMVATVFWRICEPELPASSDYNFTIVKVQFFFYSGRSPKMGCPFKAGF